MGQPTRAVLRRPAALVDAIGEREQPVRVAAALAVALAVVLVGLFALPVKGPGGLLVAIAGAGIVALLLGSPFAAFVALLLTSFLRLALQGFGLPAEPMVLVLAALMAATGVAVLGKRIQLHVGPLEWAMCAYLAWNLVSMLVPHELPPVVPLTGEPVSVYRFIITGTIMPFVAYVIARSLLRSEHRVRRMMIGLVLLAAYSAVMSVLQFTGPRNLVWPPYIVTAPTYPERAVGVVNQPLVNGLIMVAGFVTAVFLAQHRSLSWRMRLLMLCGALLCVPGIYLTKTRAAWLVFGVGVLLCAVFGRGARRGFVVTILAATLFIGVNWATFTSSDREAGGVASAGEVEDRLNSIATSVWAIDQKPLFGWGIGRFAQVNAQHHKQWEPSTDFRRGYAIASHENELGIATELGLIGLVLWLAVALMLVGSLLRALRRLPVDGLAGRALGLIAVTVLGTWIVSGFTADLRFFDFANLLTFTFVGAAVGVAAGVADSGDEAPPRAPEPRAQPRLRLTGPPMAVGAASRPAGRETDR